MELTKVRLQIAGSNYVISTTDSESYVHELAERLDKDMKDILESAPSASVTQAAVLAALDYLDELQKSTVTCHAQTAPHSDRKDQFHTIRL